MAEFRVTARVMVSMCICAMLSDTDSVGYGHRRSRHSTTHTMEDVDTMEHRHCWI